MCIYVCIQLCMYLIIIVNNVNKYFKVKKGKKMLIKFMVTFI